MTPILAVNDCVFGSVYVSLCVCVCVLILPRQSLLFLNWQELIISGLALICEVQQGEFEHLSHFKVVSVEENK